MLCDNLFMGLYFTHIYRVCVCFFAYRNGLLPQPMCNRTRMIFFLVHSLIISFFYNPVRLICLCTHTILCKMYSHSRRWYEISFRYLHLIWFNAQPLTIADGAAIVRAHAHDLLVSTICIEHLSVAAVCGVIFLHALLNIEIFTHSQNLPQHQSSNNNEDRKKYSLKRCVAECNAYRDEDKNKIEIK